MEVPNNLVQVLQSLQRVPVCRTTLPGGSSRMYGCIAGFPVYETTGSSNAQVFHESWFLFRGVNLANGRVVKTNHVTSLGIFNYDDRALSTFLGQPFSIDNNEGDLQFAGFMQALGDIPGLLISAAMGGRTWRRFGARVAQGFPAVRQVIGCLSNQMFDTGDLPPELLNLQLLQFQLEYQSGVRDNIEMLNCGPVTPQEGANFQDELAATCLSAAAHIIGLALVQTEADVGNAIIEFIRGRLAADRLVHALTRCRQQRVRQLSRLYRDFYTGYYETRLTFRDMCNCLELERECCLGRCPINKQLDMLVLYAHGGQRFSI